MHCRTTILGLFTFLAAMTALAAAGSSAKARNGQISFWSDRAFAGRAQVFVMNSDASRQRRLTSLFSAKRGYWSPNGRRILFSSWRDGNPEVCVVNADGRGLRRLTRSSREDFAADFSPDGRKILLSSGRSGLRQVYTMNLDGSGIRNLSRSRSNDWATSWQALR
jgi:TolB protein